MNRTFNAIKAVEDTTAWIRNWFADNGNGCTAIVGLSGGKDSSVVAALCVKALGSGRVFGVLMPNKTQSDIDCSMQVAKHLGINHAIANIGTTVTELTNSINMAFPTEQATINLPARIRMATLYYYSQCLHGRVANTCNLSEDWVGYATRYGDGAGDFSPLSNFTVSEVKQMGYVLGLPEFLVEKTPIDGLCGKTDEENLGFTYEVLDRYIREHAIDDIDVKAKIDDMHNKNLFKLSYMSCFDMNPSEYYN